MTTRVERRRAATVAEIKAVARRQIATEGASNFSLGAVARAMGLTPPALYRYFESRDALVVALMIDAYDAMGQALEAARDGTAGRAHGARFLALLEAYRAWAVAQPEAFALMYGTSTEAVVMSEAQGAEFQRAVLRSMGAMVAVLGAAHADGVLVIPPAYESPPPSVLRALTWMRAALRDRELPVGLLALALTTWLHADGLVWQELHGHLPPTLFGEGEFYTMEARVLAEWLGL